MATMIRRSETALTVKAHAKAHPAHQARNWSEDDRKLAMAVGFMLLALFVWFGSSFITPSGPSSTQMLANNSGPSSSSRSDAKLTKAAGLSEN